MIKPQFPRYFNFSNLPTPVMEIDNNSIPSSYSLLIKRDDQTGIELSGNKIRKLDFLLREAVDNGAERIITCGGVQSNHCRATAFAANRIDLKKTLVLKGNNPDFITGNFLLSKMSGAEIIFVSEEEYQDVDSYMTNLAKKYEEKSYIIPEGGSNDVGAWGYVKCFFEILDQIKENDLNCDTIVVATGSGGTHAGLLVGKILAQSNINIVSVNVCDNAEYFVEKINGILDRFKQKNNLSLKREESDINIIDGFVGEGYGQVSGWEEKMMIKIVQKYGLIFDPVYGVKAFGGMLNLMEKKKIPGKDVMFIHTGGVFGVFPYWRELQNVLAKF